MKKYIGYTGKFPRSDGHSFDGLLESLKQDEKLWVDYDCKNETKDNEVINEE